MKDIDKLMNIIYQNDVRECTMEPLRIPDVNIFLSLSIFAFLIVTEKRKLKSEQIARRLHLLYDANSKMFHSSSFSISLVMKLKFFCIQHCRVKVLIVNIELLWVESNAEKCLLNSKKVEQNHLENAIFNEISLILIF